MDKAGSLTPREKVEILDSHFISDKDFCVRTLEENMNTFVMVSIKSV